jgi:flagellar biosynthesis/type III secretory pathway protein FliH
MLIQVGKAMAEGCAEGLAEGWAKGVAEGLAEGRAEGRAEGLVKGLAKGLAEGRAEGRAQGIREAALYAARLLLKKKFPAEMAEKVTGLSHAEIQALAEEIFREDAVSFKDLA